VKNNNRSIILSLALLFMLPSFLAYIFYLQPNWFGLKNKNKGNLIEPVLHVGMIKPSNKWQLILVDDSDCKTPCLMALDKLKRIRMSLGRDMYRTTQSLVTLQKIPHDFKRQLSVEGGLDTSVKLLSTSARDRFNQVQALPAIFIADPHANIIMVYRQSVSPDDIYQDFKHLLKASNLG
jgi:hypothetical protein